MSTVVDKVVANGPENSARQAAEEARQGQVTPIPSNPALGRDEAPTPTPPATPAAPNYRSLGELLSADEYSRLVSDPVALNATLAERLSNLDAERRQEREDAGRFHALMSDERVVGALRQLATGGQTPAPQQQQAPSQQLPADAGLAARLTAMEERLGRMAEHIVGRALTEKYPDFQEVKPEVDKLLRAMPHLDIESAYMRAQYERQQRAPKNGSQQPTPPMQQTGVRTGATGQTGTWSEERARELLDRKKYPESVDAYRAIAAEVMREQGFS